MNPQTKSIKSRLSLNPLSNLLSSLQSATSMSQSIDSSSNLQQPERTATNIQNSRLTKEMEFLTSINRKYQKISTHQVSFPDLLDDHQTLHIFIPQQYPFREPQYALSNSIAEHRPVSDAIQEWTPKIKIFQLIELLAQRINQLQNVKKQVKTHPLLRPFHSKRAIPLLIVLAILLRIMVGLGSYSGEGDYPNLGDFQAHRNWMSITLNRPITSWYQQTDQQPWWRIDYPPIAAYLSYFFGKIYQAIEPESMKMQFGYESQNLKVYMRLTSLIIDMLCLFPPIYLLSSAFQKKLPQLLLLLFLLKPDAILIDHGHFQYNSLILGLILLSFHCILNQQYYLTCLLFTITLHSKQMAVYYSLAFLSALIGLTYQQLKYDRAKFTIELLKYATIVVVVSIGIWAPWMGSLQNLKEVFTAIFPVHRGLYQLKVGNFWCITDTVIEWQKYFAKSTLVIFCFISSFALSIPSMLSLALNPTKKSLVMGFATISLTFFMFSYHVHEKSILLPLLMMPLVGEVMGGWLAFEMVVAGTVGLFHLLREDHQVFGYFGMMGLYILFGVSYNVLRGRVEADTKEKQFALEWHLKVYDRPIFRILFMTVIILLHMLALFCPAPINLPYLWHLLMAFLPFCLSTYFLLLSNLIQLQRLHNIFSNQHHKNT